MTGDPVTAQTGASSHVGKLSFDNTAIAFQSKSNNQLRKAYWLFRVVASSTLTKIGKVLTRFAMALRLPVKWAIKPTVFAQFCGGETVAECAETTKELDKYNIGTILDYSVEGKEEEKDFDATTEEICKTIHKGNNNAHIPFCVFKVSGVGRTRLLKKVNAKRSLNTSEKAEWQRLRDRVEKICRLANEAKTPVFIDAEESWLQDAIDGLANEMMERYNRDEVAVYNTIQLYRHDRLAFLKKSHEEAKGKGFILAVKLVRGAYMEKEADRAEDKGYPNPIHSSKANTDRDFDASVEFCLDHIDNISVCVGSHNEASCLRTAELMSQKGIEKGDKRVYVAQLYGMSDHISFNMSDAGYNVAKYVPYGPIREVMPYLFRRAEENTSVEGQTGRELGLIMKEMKRRRGE